MRLFENREATAPPGGVFQYSSFGFILLGKIIENLSGQDYYNVLKQRLFKSLDMNAIGYKPEEQIATSLLTGYLGGEGKWVNNKDTLSLISAFLFK